MTALVAALLWLSQDEIVYVKRDGERTVRHRENGAGKTIAETELKTSRFSPPTASAPWNSTAKEKSSGITLPKEPKTSPRRSRLPKATPSSHGKREGQRRLK